VIKPMTNATSQEIWCSHEDIRLRELESTLQIGDIVFTRIRGAPFRKIAEVTGTWTNHVGIVVDLNRFGAVVAESCVPVCRRTRFAHFVRRSSGGRVAVLRLPRPLSDEEIWKLQRAAYSRLGRLYDTGFNLRSRRQFCSRFVHEVLHESTGLAIGETTTFRDLLQRNPGADLRLWKIWYFGHIPWERTTITPASLYANASLGIVFDGTVHRRGVSALL
jgi:permuted papain-like amidase YaeF/Yiix C92 family enzyme